MHMLYIHEDVLYFQTWCLRDTSFPHVHWTWWKLSNSAEVDLSSPGTEFTTVCGLTTDHAPFTAHGPLMPEVELTGWDSRDNQQAASVLISGLKWK